MGIRQPGMQRKERKLDGKGQEKCAEQPELRIQREPGVDQFVQVRRWPAPLCLGMQQVQGDDRQQHQQRTEHGKEKELDRGIDSAAMPPDADQEKHRDQHDLPEQVEQSQIEGQKTPMIPASMTSIRARNRPVFSVIEFHETSSATQKVKAVSMTINSEMPSSPSV